MDDIIGYVHAFELFKKPSSIRSILLPIENVPETMMIHYILNDLIKKSKSVAIVLDEYGGTSGLITVEDIIEDVVNKIDYGILNQNSIIGCSGNKLANSPFGIKI